MRMIIAGGRDYGIQTYDANGLVIDSNFNQADSDFVAQIIEKYEITEIVDGCALGADRCGRNFAKNIGWDSIKFPAAWGKYGRSAGMRRNKEMAEYADILLIFIGGKGTAGMVKIAQQQGLLIIDKRTNND